MSLSYKSASGSGRSYWEELEQSYLELYEKQKRENAAAAAAATEETLREIGVRLSELDREYGEKSRSLYREYRNSGKDLAERLNASGITGGAAESSRTALRVGYENGRSALESDRSSRAAALETEGIRAENENRRAAEKADAAAEEKYYGYRSALRKEYRSALEQQAKLLADGGDFSGYAELGYGEEELEQLRTAWVNKNPKQAMTALAAKESYGGAEVAALSPLLAQYYLAALGFSVKATGVWDKATEKAFKTAFGTGSGRY